jgi:hypothetical protein
MKYAPYVVAAICGVLNIISSLLMHHDPIGWVAAQMIETLRIFKHA